MEDSHRTPLVSAMRRAYQQGIEDHGEIGVTYQSLESRFLSIISKSNQPDGKGLSGIVLLKRLFTSDLYLATGCLSESSAAWRRFDVLYHRRAFNIAFNILRSGDIARDLADELPALLLLPTGNGQSRLSSYEGRGSLSSWLAIVIRNAAVKMSNRKSNVVGDLDAASGLADPRIDPEQRLQVEQLSALVTEAFKEASRVLTNHERVVLTLRYVHEVSFTQIARANRMRPSSITRKIERIHTKLRKGMVAHLSERGLDQAEIEAHLSEVVNNPSLYILTLFASDQYPDR